MTNKKTINLVFLVSTLSGNFLGSIYFCIKFLSFGKYPNEIVGVPFKVLILLLACSLLIYSMYYISKLSLNLIGFIFSSFYIWFWSFISFMILISLFKLNISSYDIRILLLSLLSILILSFIVFIYSKKRQV